MNLKKIYLIIYIISFSFLLGDGVSFRGKTSEQLMSQPIPLAFANMVMNNYNILPSQINPQRGTFLIIAPDGIIQYLGDFVSFKNSQGFDVDVIALSEAGESASLIKSTIANKLAEDPMLEYVLLLGDVDGFASFPSFYYGPENDVSDQKYTHILGDDNIPDVFIGRLSIDSLSDLAVIMAKTMQYVKNPLLYDSDWLSRGLIVAGNYSNSYPIPITPKWTSYWLRDELLDYGYNQIDTVFYPPVQQGAPYIIPSINNGVGIVNYRGWGDANGWHYPEFHTDDVNDLNNGWLTPVFFSWVCNSNDFANNVDPCLSESVLRGGTPSIPKGGVAFIGPSDLHTSTKYNNVINAYTYDAMLNHGVVELGPAMQAGQSGLLKEFPAQNGPGEAQEFYAHVYNILGDPSLPVYIDTPGQFTMNVEDIYANDGLVDLTLTNVSGNTVNNAVISIMGDDQLLSKGITDDEGRFLTSIDVYGGMQLEVYANKGGFIQGHTSVVIQPESSDISIANMNVISENGGDKSTLGELINLTLELKNNSEGSISAFTGEIIFSTGVEPNLFQVNIPAMASGGIESLNSIEFSCYSASVGNTIHGQLNDQNGNTICEFVIEVELPVFNVSFENSSINPNSDIETILSVSNFSGGTYQNIWIEISALSEGADVTINSTSNLSSNFAPFSTTSNGTNYEIAIGDV
ncbi:MAG TPA: C25 family cysteine peptidase, partial [Candidatus Marinimicrobia bacterium]|nr:C25 family cysteine peptidase [Candidatus Neomarinimicrobiota bacterium]